MDGVDPFPAGTCLGLRAWHWQRIQGWRKIWRKQEKVFQSEGAQEESCFRDQELGT